MIFRYIHNTFITFILKEMFIPCFGECVMCLGKSLKESLTSYGNKVARKEAPGLQPPFLPPSVSASFAELPAALCGDRASRGSHPLWSIGATMRRVQGRIYHFQWKASGDF